MNARSKRWFGSGQAVRNRPKMKRAEQAEPSTTEARSAALPACSDGFDDIDGGPECGVYIQMRGIEQVRIGGGFERGDRPRGVALVAAQDVGEDLGLARLARRPPAAPGRGGGRALGAVAVTKILTSASGKMTVPMSRPSSTAPGGERPKSRWKASKAARTCGMAETSEAASPTAWRLSAGSSKRAGSSALRGRDRARPYRRAGGRHRAAPWRPPGRAGRYRDAAARNGPPAACRACPCRRPPARRWR